MFYFGCYYFRIDCPISFDYFQCFFLLKLKNHYLENEYGEEGGKAVKMQQDGKTSFLEYILRRSEYEKMYKQNGINEEDDLMEQ